MIDAVFATPVYKSDNLYKLTDKQLDYLKKLEVRENKGNNFLTTRKGECVDSDGIKGFFWNPGQDEIDDSCLEGVDTLIHLAGANISKPWTPENKKEILESRLNGTRLLRKTLDRKKINAF